MTLKVLRFKKVCTVDQKESARTTQKGSTAPQKKPRTARPLTMPVLAIGGAESWGEEAGNGMKPAADDEQTVVIAGAGHWLADPGSRGDAGGVDGVSGPVPHGR